jgi:hypothetical protein
MENKENEKLILKCFDCLLIPRYYLKFKNKKTYVCSSCYCSHETVLEIYEFKEILKQKMDEIPICSKCPNKMISPNTFYFCFQCGKFICPNHLTHWDPINNLVHERICKMNIADKICPYHKLNFNSFCDGCQSPVCSKCECVINTSKEHKIYNLLTPEQIKYYKNKLKEKYNIYQNIVKIIKEKNYYDNIEMSIALKDFNNNNNDIYYFLDLLIKNYEYNNNAIMSYNIQTLFNFNDLDNNFKKNEQHHFIKFLSNPLNYCIKGVSDCLSGYDNFHNYKKKQNDTSENKI